MKGYWTKDGARWNGGAIVYDGYRVFNPSADRLAAAGYEFHAVPDYVPSLDDLKQRKISDIKSYDSSREVNEFTIDGEKIWWKKAERVGFSNMLAAEQAEGLTESGIWINNRLFTLPITRWIEILRDIEMYAGACKRNMYQHCANVANMTTAEEIEAYDCTAGYPERLNITSTKQ